MDDVLSLLFAAVAAGAPAKTQRLTVDLATQVLAGPDDIAKRNAVANLCMMTDTPRLSRDVLETLRTHEHVKVRAHWWRNGPGTEDEVLAHAAGERSATVRAEILLRHGLSAAAVETLCHPVNRTIATAMMGPKVNGFLPGTGMQALRLLGTKGSFPKLTEEVRTGTLRYAGTVTAPSGDLAALLVDAETHPLVATAVLRNEALDPAARSEHLQDVFIALFSHLTKVGMTSRGELELAMARTQLDWLANLDLSDDDINVIKALASHWTSAFDQRRWERHLDPKAWAKTQRRIAAHAQERKTGPEKPNPGFDLTKAVQDATTPEELHRLWKAMTKAQRSQFAPSIVDHLMCDLDLFAQAHAVLPKAVRGPASDFAAGQLWTVSDEGMFRELVQSDPFMALHWLEAGNLPAGAVDLPTLTGWYLDEALKPGPGDDEVAWGNRAGANVWRPLMNLPSFPRERFGEIPTEALADVIAKPSRLKPVDPWVMDAVLAALDELPEDTRPLTGGLLAATASLPFGNAVRVVAAAVA